MMPKQNNSSLKCNFQQIDAKILACTARSEKSCFEEMPNNGLTGFQTDLIRFKISSLLSAGGVWKNCFCLSEYLASVLMISL